MPPNQAASRAGPSLLYCGLRGQDAISRRRCKQARIGVRMDDTLGLPPGAFARLDIEEDELFYEEPRLVYHIDDHAVAALTEFYRDALPAGGVVLDLMSSWVSHLPPEVQYTEVIGLGMNAAELAVNPRLG